MIEICVPFDKRICQVCFTKSDVKEILFHSNGSGVAVALCDKCRKELVDVVSKDMQKETEK